jgi:hypothetical protein
VGREVVGGAAGCRGHDQPITHELGHPLYPVDRQADVGRVARVAGHRNLVEGQGVGQAPVGVAGHHRQWLDGYRRGSGDALNQVVGPVLVHEESDGAAVHPKHRPSELEVVVDGMEEQAVAAQGHDDVALVGLTGDAGLGDNRGHGLTCQSRSARQRRRLRSSSAPAKQSCRARGLLEGSPAEATVPLCTRSSHCRLELAETGDRQRPSRTSSLPARGASAVTNSAGRGWSASSMQ